MAADKLEAPIDWNAVWMEAQKRNVASGRGGECWHAWQDESAARDYLEMTSKRPVARERAADILSLAKSGWKVLDVGAGPGNIALPLAERGSRVTAVEPAPGMAAVLSARAAEAGFDSVRLVPKRWDDVEPAIDLDPPYDLSFASFSLGMLDLRASLEKMMAVTKGEIVIFWHAGHQSWDLDAMDLWPLLHGRRYDPIPKSDVVFNLLYSMGIYPEVRVLRSRTEQVFETFDEALDQYARRYAADTEARRGLLAAYLKDKLRSSGSKWLLPRSDAGMRISWKMEDHNVR